MQGRPADACVIDLDGTVYFAGREIPGAAEAVRALEAAGIPFVFATNTTRRPRSRIVERLRSFGIVTDEGRLHTAPVAAAGWLAEQGAERISLLLPEVSWEEFAAFEITDENPDFVLVGDLGAEWRFERLNTAFLSLRSGAGLVAIQRNRFWDDGTGLKLDAGPFVAALEYAAQQEAVLVGKPSTAFFSTAAGALGVPLSRVAVVGDGLENDVRGGQRAGCLGVAVRTGSFREEDLEDLERPPDAVLDSIADLPGWLLGG